jgi:sugar fermentation stimulation protein A
VRFFKKIERAEFLDRPNRFLVRCLKDGRETAAFLPNPGRLQELLLPGRTLYLVREKAAKRRYADTVVAVEREGVPIMLHTHKTNDVACFLIDKGKVPGLEKARVIGKEIPVGHSRFDLLIENEGKEILTEVKSCTLVGKNIAMFPDAVTERGARHLRELAGLSAEGRPTAVMFIVHWPRVEFFLPDYHTDLYFAQTLMACRDKIRFFPLAVKWGKDLSLGAGVKPLPIPWELIEKEAQDRGGYLLVLKLREKKTIPIGKMGDKVFRPGYYVYAGSAMANLTARIERHRRLRKNVHWHIDYLRQEAEFQAALPIRSSVSLECALAEGMNKIADWAIPGFGASDCACPTHLFGMDLNPLRSPQFISLLQYFRMDRLSLKIQGKALKNLATGIIRTRPSRISSFPSRVS